MKLLLAIPSKKRAEIFEKNTWQWLQHITAFDWKIFLEIEDIPNYNGIIANDRIVSLPEANLGLGFSKEIIKKYAQGNGYDAIFKIDDDIEGWTDFRKRQTPEESARFFEKITTELLGLFEKEKEVAGFGFPYSFQMFEKFPLKQTKRVQTAYLFRTAFFHADRRVDIFEDFAASLYAIVKNKLVFTCGLMGIDMGVPVGGGTGGHQSFKRNEERAKRCCDAMREIYPPLKLRVTPDKSWGIEPDFRSVKIGYYL
jgi:hypothetical protein